MCLDNSIVVTAVRYRGGLEVIYLGDHCKLRLRVAGNESFVARVPAGDLASTAARGTRLTVAWAAADCRALPPLE